jgi:hypothetical protein
MMKIEKCCGVMLMAVLSLTSAARKVSAIQIGEMRASSQSAKDEPRFLHGDVPLYPHDARLAHINGTVEVQVTVKDGHVADTSVKSEQPILARATVENIKTWVFQSNVNATFITKFVYEMEAEDRAAVQQTNPKIEMHLPAIVKITARPILLEDPKQSAGRRKPSH